jgi:hypothetical protein
LFIYIYEAGVEQSALLPGPLIGLLYQTMMVVEQSVQCNAMSGKEDRSTLRKHFGGAYRLHQGCEGC